MEPMRGANRGRSQSQKESCERAVPTLRPESRPAGPHAAPSLAARTRAIAGGDRTLLLRRVVLTVGILACLEGLSVLDIRGGGNERLEVASDSSVPGAMSLDIDSRRRAVELTNRLMPTALITTTASEPSQVPTASEVWAPATLASSSASTATQKVTAAAPASTSPSRVEQTSELVTASARGRGKRKGNANKQLAVGETPDYNENWELPITDGDNMYMLQMHPRVNYCRGLSEQSIEIVGGTALANIAIGCFVGGPTETPSAVPAVGPDAEGAVAACVAACARDGFAYAGLTTASTKPSCVCTNTLGALANFEAPQHAVWRNASAKDALDRCRKADGGSASAFFRIGQWPPRGALSTDVAVVAQPRPVITVFLWANPRLAAIFRTCRLAHMSTAYDYDVFDLRHQVSAVKASWQTGFLFLVRHAACLMSCDVYFDGVDSASSRASQQRVPMPPNLHCLGRQFVFRISSHCTRLYMS
jgi:hypothetical protein